MSSEKTPQFYEPQLPEMPDVSLHTAGYSVVELDDQATHAEFHAAAAQDRVDYATRLTEEKHHPADGKMRYLVAKLGGKAMSPEEADIVSEARVAGEYRVEHRRQSATHKQQEREERVMALRAQLGGIDEGRAQRIDAYLDKVAPPFFRNLRQGEMPADEQPTWVEWLTRHATNEQVINFSQWNVAHTAELQTNPDIIAPIQEQRERYKQVVPLAVEAGWLSKTVLDRYQAVDEISVRVLDPIDATIRQMDANASAHTNTVSVHIYGLQPQELTERLQGALPHEFNHKVAQTVTEAEPLGKRWIMEALTEFSARVMRSDSSVDAYPLEQGLYEDLMTTGQDQLPAQLGTRAYSGDDQEKQAFYEALDSSWGVSDVLTKVNDFVRGQERALALQGRLKGDAISNQALRTTRNMLAHYPRVIFGDSYKAPAEQVSV